MVRDTCNCGKQVLMMISWTDLNPKRRFCRCPNYRVIPFPLYRNRGMQVLGLGDPEMCQRSKDIIPGLIRTKNKLEFEIERLQENSKLQEAKLRRLKMFLFLHWVVAVAWILLFNSGP
nr:uncharacterized protein LOC113696605 [Coffea arabica]